MNKVLKTRLCWNCEGSVSIAEETCPFCGVSVVPASLDPSPLNNFAPPYSIDKSTSLTSPYIVNNEQFSQVQEELEPSIDEFKKTIIATSLLLTGSVFFIFGLALMLFSTDGVFILRWNGTLWFIYSALSLPLLLLGWRSLMKLE